MSVGFLSREVEPEAHAVVVLAQFADGGERRVATHGAHSLQDGEQLLRLEEQADARGGCRDIGIEGEEERLDGHLPGAGIVSVGTADGLSSYLARELVVVAEGEVGVGSVDARIVVIGLELTLDFLRCHLAAGFCQQVVAGESASRSGIAPGAHQILLCDLVQAKHAAKHIAQDACTIDSTEQPSGVAAHCGTAGEQSHGHRHCQKFLFPDFVIAPPKNLR